MTDDSMARTMQLKVKHALVRHQPRLLARLLRVKPNWNRDLFTFLNLLHKGDVILDVGANEGAYTEIFAHIVGKTGCVHAFEPVPPTFECLKKRCESTTQVRLHPFAVSDRSGQVVLQLPGADSGQASMREHHEGSWARPDDIRLFECPSVTLDEFVTREKLSRVDFLKIDIEGAELFALRGAVEILRAHRPLIFIEVWEQWTRDFGYTHRDLAQFLKAAGYDRYFTVSRQIESLTDLDSAWQPALAQGSHNLVAAIASHHSSQIASFVRAL